MRPRTKPDFFEEDRYLANPSWQPLRRTAAAFRIENL